MKFKENENVLLVEHTFNFTTKENITKLKHGTVTKANTASIYVSVEGDVNNIIRFKNVKNPVYNDWVFGQIKLFHSEDEYTKHVYLEMNSLLDDATAHINRINKFKDELDYSEMSDVIDVLNGFNNKACYVAEE